MLLNATCLEMGASFHNAQPQCGSNADATLLQLLCRCGIVRAPLPLPRDRITEKTQSASGRYFIADDPHACYVASSTVILTSRATQTPRWIFRS